MKSHRKLALFVLILLSFIISVFCTIDGKDYNLYDGTPAAIPVLTPEEAVKANEEAVCFYEQRKEELQRQTALAKTASEPVAVPVLSPEEAVRANKEAIRFQRNKKFLSFIHKIHGGNAPPQSPFDMSFMIKPFNNNKPELTIDDSKVQSIDILPTLLKITCGDNADFKDFEGIPSFDVPNERIRKVWDSFIDETSPSPDPDLDRCYPGLRGLEEHTFVDIKSFRYGQKSQSFVRMIPLVVSSQENK